MFPNRLRLIVLLLFAVAAAVGGWMYHEHHRFKHFTVHEPGMVYRSAWLDPDAFAELIEEHQIRTVVNLCAPGEFPEKRFEDQRRAVRSTGARLLEMSMPTAVNPATPEIAQHIEIMANPDNYPMLVHCQHGVTRTAKFLAIYDMIYRNKTADESLASQPTFGRSDHNVHIRSFARQFEARRPELYPQAKADSLEVLRH